MDIKPDYGLLWQNIKYIYEDFLKVMNRSNSSKAGQSKAKKPTGGVKVLPTTTKVSDIQLEKRVKDLLAP